MKLLKFFWYFLCWPGYLTLFLKYLNPVEWSKTRNVAETARRWRFRHILAPFITAGYVIFLLILIIGGASDSSNLDKDEEPTNSTLPLIDDNGTPASSSSPPSLVTAAQNIIPVVFQGVHSDGPYTYNIAANSIINFDGDEYIVKKTDVLNEGSICVVTVNSSREEDVITLRKTSRGKTIITSRKLDDAWERYEAEGGDAPD